MPQSPEKPKDWEDVLLTLSDPEADQVFISTVVDAFLATPEEKRSVFLFHLLKVVERQLDRLEMKTLTAAAGSQHSVVETDRFLSAASFSFVARKVQDRLKVFNSNLILELGRRSAPSTPDEMPDTGVRAQFDRVVPGLVEMG